MPFSPAPLGFFGNGYAITSSEIKIPTVDFADITIGTFTCDGTTSVVTVSVAHNLKVGDKVSLSTTTTLPAPFTAADHFVVAVLSTTTVRLSLTKGGTAIVSTNTGTGTHTVKALAPLQLVTDAQAHATTGDWPTILRAILELAYQKYNNTPTADRPTATSITKASRSNTSDPDTQITTYSLTVRSKVAFGDVISV